MVDMVPPAQRQVEGLCLWLYRWLMGGKSEYIGRDARWEAADKMCGTESDSGRQQYAMTLCTSC
jgi:hypothetical protein